MDYYSATEGNELLIQNKLILKNFAERDKIYISNAN